MVVEATWARTAHGVLFIFVTTPLLAQGTWSSDPTAGAPQSLARHAAAYDLQRQMMVLFGGHDQQYQVLASTWEFDGVTWTPRFSFVTPPARQAAAMVYDAIRGRMLLFGGAPTTQVNGPLDDTWEYDGNTWTQLAPATTPPPRYSHAMCYDLAQGVTVMFGGRMASNMISGDTWLWDGSNWQQQAGPGPSPRTRHAIAYDLNRNRSVLFGGYDGGTTLGDTWEWNGASWSQHATTAVVAPPARSGHGMAADLSRSVIVMHGGMPGGTDTWEWDGTTWSQHGSTATPKTDHSIIYDARLQRTTLYGGMHPLPPMALASETATYGQPVPGTFTPRGGSCPASFGTPQLAAPTTGVTGPVMGQSANVFVTSTWLHTWFVLGWSESFDGTTPLPLNLAGHGMPGCELQVSQDSITSVPPQNGVSTLTIHVPSNPFLVGLRFYVQGFVLDPAANPRGFATTNRLAAFIGRN